MLTFGKLNQIKKTYDKEGMGPRGQNYEGLKYRKSVSKKGANVGDVTERITFSDKLIESLKLNEHGFIQFNDVEGEGDAAKVTKVYLALVSDKREDCKILKDSNKGDKKTFSVRVPVLFEDLKTTGLVKDEQDKNQYFNLVKVEVADLPSDIFGVYELTEDTSVNEEEAEEGEEVADVQPVAESNDF